MDKRERQFLHNKGLTPDDYYFDERGLLVYTDSYHLKRGYCCRSGCRHCPYTNKEGSTGQQARTPGGQAAVSEFTEW